MRRVFCGLAWAAVLYFVGCKIVGGVAGTWAGATQPEREETAAPSAAAEAVDAGLPYLIGVAILLAAAGTWSGVLPGTERTPSPLPRTVEETRGQRLNRLLARSAMALLAFFLTFAIALHLLRPEYDPASRFLSEYAVGPYGTLMSAGLALSGASAVVLGLAWQRAFTRSFWLMVGSICLMLAGIGYIMCGLFPTDLYPQGGGPYRVRTVSGVLHDNLATTSAIFATVAFLLLPWACRRCARWRPFFRPAIIFACAAAVAFVIGGRAPREYAGLGQRLWVATLAVCCLMLAYRVGAMSSSDASDYSRSEEGEAAMS